MSSSMKIVVPMAGWGTRMRPHTWSKPKPLVAVAGRTALDYLLDSFGSVPNLQNAEFVFILSPYLGEIQIPPFIHEHYPNMRAHFVVQAEMKGQSHALYLARQYLSGPMIMCFSDTLIEADFSILDGEKSQGVAWVKAISDPRRFGVAEVNRDGWVTRLIEKPQNVENNLALVGCYYFKEGEDLLSAIEEQMRLNVQLKHEFFLVDAINIMLESRALFRTQQIETWLDTGTFESTLEANRHLLERANFPVAGRPGVTLKAPVFVHGTAVVTDSEIGPHVSIGAGCKVSGSRIQDSVLDADCQISDAAVRHSLLGRRASVRGRTTEDFLTLNIGDDSSISAGGS